MKILKYSTFSALVAALLFAVSCAKVQSPLPDFETGIYCYGVLTNASFSIANPATPVAYKWRWVSTDSKNTASKVEYYVTFTQSYSDKDGNDRVANHGTKLWKVLEGSAIGANRIDIDGSITQADVYNLFKDATFDYGLGAGKLNVFSQYGRKTANPFIKADGISITWYVTTADGRKFTEWSVALCDGETVGANCSMDIGVK